MKFYIEDNEALPAIQALDDSAPAPTGYTELDKTILNVNTYWKKKYDYVYITKEIATLFQAKTGDTETDKWDSCTTEERVILAERQVVSKNLRLSVVTDSEDKASFQNHAAKSITARGTRVQVGKLEIGYELSVTDRQDLFNEVSEMLSRYINTNDPSFKAWMDVQFKAKSYWTQGLHDIYTAVIVNGEY